jgi:hypothetical protein
MQDPKELLDGLYKRRDELNLQLQYVNQAIESTQLAFGIAHKSTSESSTPAMPVADAYSRDFPMDKKVYLILKEIKEGTVSDIVSSMLVKEPGTVQDTLLKAVSMAVSRLHTQGNPKYIPTPDGKLKSKPDAVDSRKKIYFL